MLTPTILIWLLTIGLVAYRCHRSLFDRPKNFPSGPPKLPFLGGYAIMLLLNYRHLHKAANQLCSYYKTKLLGIYLADFPAVIVNDHALVKEVQNRVEFDGRPDLFLARLREKNFKLRGIFFTQGSDWKEQRRFIFRHLRDYGFGRRFDELEAETNSEILTLIEMLRYGPKYAHEAEFMTKDGYVMCPNVFFACFANAFLHVLSGERINREEAAVLIETGKFALTFQRTTDDYGTINSLRPWVRHIFPNLTKYRTIREASLGVNRFIESVIQKRLETHEEGHERCFLDVYFNEMKKTIPRDEDDRFTFQHDQLVLGIVDFFFPAISGATVQIALLLERLLWHPEVVQKMQAEIDDVVGSGRLPSLDDRINLPYTEATLREGMRIDTLVPSGIAHMATRDTTLSGYDIPKDTVLLLGLDYIHMQKDVWGDPESFRPERFLDQRGKLSLAKDVSVPFGAGKRLCAGETFARNTMFLIVSALVQNFNIKQRPGEKLPDLGKRLTGVIISPPDYWIRFEPR
ncbi:probable cytochrome P450 304a1 [Armigeres subalbatus]|uniref:probable cytochrome P450 304a1 n=1 Tax=Armigeres subalbatus TaxID=124917 RepID=UPI002ED38F68